VRYVWVRLGGMMTTTTTRGVGRELKRAQQAEAVP
jgi:hypothetical protein